MPKPLIQAWLTASERPPVHLLRLLPDEELRSSPAEPERSSRQTGELFSSPEPVADRNP
ncbi:MAG TPA: hypothetical protein VMD92_04885 [Acidobacteriaceae bacterium]|nr:hypothetical protein [Acidobacteriaceae bacterium]